MRFSLFKRWLVIVLVLSCTKLSNAQEPATDGADSVQVGKPAPDFALAAADGQRVSLSDFHGENGKYVVAVFVRAHW